MIELMIMSVQVVDDQMIQKALLQAKNLNLCQVVRKLMVSEVIDQNLHFDHILEYRVKMETELNMYSV